MDLFNQQEQQEAKEETPTDYTGIIVVVLTLPIAMFFAHIGKRATGNDIGICLAMNMIAIKFRWELRKHIWFWIVAILVPAIEIPFVYRIQWPHRWVPKIELMPIGVGAVMIMLGAIWCVQKIMGKVSPSDEKERDDL